MSKQNAKEEFVKWMGTNPIKCATILHTVTPWDTDENAKRSVLKVNHSKEEFKQFLDSLDYTYDSGYGGQELFGTVWFEDGTWADRGEHDSSEWWEHHECPEIPKELK